MRRPLTLRQIDIFRAVIEAGTVSKAADILGVSQPAASKMLNYLEQDTGLKLFERVKGRLVPSAVGLRLYEEVEKVFSGVQQIEKMVDALRREEQERLTIGIIPAMTSFIAEPISRFMAQHPEVAVSVDTRSSQYVVEWISTRRVDIGLLSDRIDVPYLESRTLLRRNLVCIVAPDSPLAAKDHVTIADLRDQPLIGYTTLNQTQQQIAQLFDGAGFRPHMMLEASTAQLMCECVAVGGGVAIVHPLALAGFEDRVVARPMLPEMPIGYQLCWYMNSRNSHLIEDLRATIVDCAEAW